MLMLEPKYPQAFSERFGNDDRRQEITTFKNQNQEVISVLQEIAARKAELVDQTPFDNFEDNLALELIDKRLAELYELIQNNPVAIKKYVEGAIEPVGENIQQLQDEFRLEMEILNQKIDRLLPKVNKDRQMQPLRDPIDKGLFPIFLASAGHTFQRKKDLKKAQLRVTYTILYHCGVRINEIRHLTLDDIERAIEASQLSLVHHKTKQAHIHVLSEKAIYDLRKLNTEFSIIFDKYQYEFLFGKKQPIHHKNLIAMVNKDLKETCKQYSIPLSIKSHSFRVNMITI